MFQAGKTHSASRCSSNCATHNQTLDLLEARLRDVEQRFTEYLAQHTHIATVMAPLPEDDDGALEAIASLESFWWE